MNNIEIYETQYYIFYKKHNDLPKLSWRHYSGPYKNEQTAIDNCKQLLQQFPATMFKPIRKTMVIETIPIED